MISVPSIKIDNYAQKTSQAITAIYEMQTKVIQQKRSFTPTQREISSIHSLIFKARLQNQQLCNQWFEESVTQMVLNVNEHFKATHCQTDSFIINDFLQATDLLKYYIYYSGVFLIDAKETNRLYSIGLQKLKDLFIIPSLPIIINQIWNLSRDLPLCCSLEIVSQKLYQARELLEIIRACGWQNATIIRNRDGQLTFTSSTQMPNTFFSSCFEQPFNSLIKEYLSKVPHTPPLSVLRNHLSKERMIVHFLSSSSADRIMEQIETDSLKKVVTEVGDEISEMIKQGRDDEVEAVVELFETIDVKQINDSKFQLGVQYKPVKEEEQNKPFKILAKMFGRFLLLNEPDGLHDLLNYMTRFDEYLKRVFRNQKEIRIGYLEALEKIANKKKDLSTQILQFSDKKNPQIAVLASLLYGNNFQQEYFEIAKQEKDLEFIKLYRQNCAEGSLRWWKAVECERYQQQLQQKTNINDQLQLTIISKIHFNEFKENLIAQKYLPNILSDLLPKEKNKSLSIVSSQGYGVVQYNNYNLILTTEQLILLLLVDEGKSTKSQLKTLHLSKALEQLLKAQLLLKESESFIINSAWSAKKKTIQFFK